MNPALTRARTFAVAGTAVVLLLLAVVTFA